MQASRSLGARLLAQSVRRYHQEGFKPPTMDELPVPKGSWQQHYDRQNRKYNATLAAGIGFAVFTAFVAKQSDLFYFNWSPPNSID